MRKVVLLISCEAGLLCIAIVGSIMTDILPVWGWSIGAVLFLVVIPTILYWPEVKTELMAHGTDPGDILGARFKAAYPLIRELAETNPPYSQTKVGALQRELNVLGIKYPVNHPRWPKYLSHLGMLAKKGKVEQARTIPEYLDTIP